LGPFRSPLLRTSRLISLPPGTEMFQFPGFASHSRGMTGITASRVAPFGHLGITACVPLPRASRSLPRPSSPPCAQASPTCLPSLDYKNRSSRAYAHCFKTSDVFLRKSHLKGFFNPTIYQHPLSNSDRPSWREPRGQQSRVEWTECVEAKRLRDDFPRLRRSHADAVTRRSVKEVIQPQVPLRLPCYDFAPVTALAFGRLLSCELRHGLRALTASMA
jgi:hypothetical protein